MNAREISEKLIDALYSVNGLNKNPRTYRQNARKDYLALAKQRNPRKNKRRAAIRQQLQYVKRNLGHLENLLDLVADKSTAFTHRQRRQYWIIQQVYRQQEEMHCKRIQRCDDRIVSISQPYIRR